MATKPYLRTRSEHSLKLIPNVASKVIVNHNCSEHCLELIPNLTSNVVVKHTCSEHCLKLIPNLTSNVIVKHTCVYLYVMFFVLHIHPCIVFDVIYPCNCQPLISYMPEFGETTAWVKVNVRPRSTPSHAHYYYHRFIQLVMSCQ